MIDLKTIEKTDDSADFISSYWECKLEEEDEEVFNYKKSNCVTALTSSANCLYFATKGFKLSRLNYSDKNQLTLLTKSNF